MTRSLAARLSFLAALSLASGCTSIDRSPGKPTDEEEQRHIIRVNERGVLLTLNGKPAPVGYAEEYIVAPLQAALGQRPDPYANGVLVFVHGGLNDYPSARNHFQKHYYDLIAAGYYPLFVAWPSGLTGTYREHLLKIRQGRREDGKIGRIFAATTLPFVFVQDFTTGLVRTPMTTFNSLRSDLQTTIPPDVRIGERDAVRTYRELQAGGEHVAIGDDYKTLAAQAGRFASYVVTLPTKIASAGPFIDALGRPAWDDMLRRTYMVFPGTLADNEGFLGPAPEGTTRQNRRDEAQSLGFFNVVRALEVLQKPSLPFKVTLVGHSMGAIVLNHLLQVTTLKIDRIVYLAAACTVRDYSQSVLPYLVKYPDARSYNVMLHPMAEDGEMQEAWLDTPPRGSLLVWIDNFLSNPVYEQDRTFGRWINLFMPAPSGNSAIEDVLHHRGVRHRIHFRAFGVGTGKESRPGRYQWNPGERPDRTGELGPETHAEMAEIEFWCDDVLFQGAPSAKP